MRERPVRRLAVAAAASIVVNGVALLLLARAGAFSLAASPDRTRVALAPIPAAQWEANRAVRAERADRGARPTPEPFAMPRPPPKPQPEPEADRAAMGQVVDVAPSRDATPPKSTRFVSDRDSSVEKETRSRHAKAGYERTLPVPSAPGAQAAPAGGEDGQSQRSVLGVEGPAAASARAPGAREVPPERDGLLASAPRTAAGEGTAAAPVPGAGEGGERRAGSPSDRRLIAPGTLARIAGGPAPDHLEGVEEGEGTYLNTRGWKYATYFNRIKQQIAAAWDPMAPLDARDPDRSMFGRDDRFTLLGVTLDQGGHVKNLVVEQTSGVDFLDRAAMTAFQTAQPFVNPPRGIADANGEIKFSFGFFVELGRPGLRLFRAPASAMP